MIFRVEQYDAQMLLLKVTHLDHQQICYVARTGDLGPLLRLRQQQAPPDLQRRLDLRCFGLAQTVNFDHLLKAEPLQPNPAPMLDQQLARQLNDIDPCDAGSEQDRQQFSIAQGGGAVITHSFARLLGSG